MIDLESKIKLLPENSGVYIMRDIDGTIIYIGKAKNLKNRVSQYFNKSAKTDKVLAMVSKIRDFEYIITPNEIDALVLENNLIKEHKPHYNIMLKDDKAYPYIKINLKEKFPKLEITRRLKTDKSKYYGPYMQGITIGSVIEIVNSVFGLRSCNLNFEKIPKGHRPCLNYHIGRCTAPCENHISEEEYMALISDVMDFLSGNNNKALKLVEEKMLAASEKEDYDSALFYKDKLNTLQRLNRHQIAAIPKEYNMDIFSIIDSGAVVSIAILILRNGLILGGDTFAQDVCGLSESQLLSTFIVSYYDKNPLIADEILTTINVDDSGIIKEYLLEKYHKSVSIICPKIGIKKQLADMAYNNALNNMANNHKMLERKENLTTKALEQLAEYIKIKPLNRIECYDNSNISGTNPVSSMIVYEHGEPSKSHYRHFRVKNVIGPNDFLTMYEILVRRFNELKEGKDLSFKCVPDLILIDGGKGQLSSAVKAMNDSNLNLNIVSLAKKEELIFKPDEEEPVVLPINCLPYLLIQRIRDEAHRFAISYHRSIREKKQTESLLLEIEGVGKNRIKLLFETFKTIDKIKKASLDELKGVKGIPKDVAENIYNYFNKI
jgi:excinuclease ABC subunit C